MASTLSSIGFVFADEGEYEQTMTRLVNAAVVRLACDAGEYGIWRSRTGAEIWFHLVPDAPGSETLEPVGLTPFFEGMSESSFGADLAYRQPGDNPLEGRLRGHVAARLSGPGGETESDCASGYPLVVDCVDFAAHFARPLPATWSIRLTAFAHVLTAYRSEMDYLAVPDRPLGIGSKSFIAWGILQSKAEGADDPWTSPDATRALLTGRVLEHALHTNEETRHAFHWLLIESADDIRYDVVADPEVVEGEIVVGGIVEVRCAIAGRILD